MNTMKALLVMAAVSATACQGSAPATGARVSGQVDATEVQVAPEVGGRIIEMTIAEGDRVKQGDVVARLDTRDIDLALQRAQAERSQADAQLRLLQAGARGEDIRQAEAQVAATSADVAAAQADLAAAETDLQRFEKLLQSNSGSQKQRDDAATRRDMARDRLAAARARVTGAREGVARLRAGSRREEIEAARARVAGVDAQIATLEKYKGDATITAPIGGVVTERLPRPGESCRRARRSCPRRSRSRMGGSVRRRADDSAHQDRSGRDVFTMPAGRASGKVATGVEGRGHAAQRADGGKTDRSSSTA